MHYGSYVDHIGDEPFHDFPSPQALAGKKVESHLRELGFGYRAKYIAETARLVSMEKPAGWLETLTNPENPQWGQIPVPTEGDPVTYKQAHEALLSLSGVGPKVADCVCLMGLGWSEAVPVDTHVWQIAQRDYRFGKTKTKTFSKAMYHSVGDHFRLIWGPQAGWAQSVLFTANLKSFSEQATADIKALDVAVKAEQEVKIESSPAAKKRRGVRTVQQIKVEHEEPPPIKAISRKRKTRS